MTTETDEERINRMRRMLDIAQRAHVPVVMSASDMSFLVNRVDPPKRQTKTKAKKITPQEFAERMAEIAKMKDVESRHTHADGLMEEVLEALGYDEGLKIYDDMTKWSA